MISIQTLIRHLVMEHMEQITTQSYLHCHAKGLHSIMLLNSPEQTIRLFYADMEHTLWRNFPAGIGQGPMSIGFHSHHCNITLHVILGKIFNWIVAPAQKGFILDAYAWNSPIKGGAGDFALYQQGITLDTVAYTQLDEQVNPVDVLDAQAIHTVAIEHGKPAAWLVYEGREDPAYEPITMSNADLSTADLSGMYIKPTDEQLRTILIATGLI